MGWTDCWVLENGIIGLPLIQGPYQSPLPGFKKADTLTAGELAKLKQDSDKEIVIIDVASNGYYQEKHIPGSFWGIRSRLEVDLSKMRRSKTLILTSEDGTLAHLAARDLKDTKFGPEVLVLDGGTTAWINAGLPTTKGMEQAPSEPDDTWYMPYMHPDAPEQAKREYLEWELGLVAQVERDGTAKFRTFPAH
ncbi:MAG: rhodanese-like domain-containing protein [Desulfobaccales bacterium]